MSKLCELPTLVLENIIRLSDFASVLTLRKVSPYFRSFIDELKDTKLPDSKIVEIFFVGIDRHIILILGDTRRPRYRIQYSENNKSRVYQGKITAFDDVDVEDLAIRDLELLLKFQRGSLKRLHFKTDENSTIPTKLADMLQSFTKNRKIKVKHLRTYGSIPFHFLQYLDAEVLKMVDFNSPNNFARTDQIVNMEQWKRIENFCCTSSLDLNVRNFCHFFTADVILQSISADGLNFLKETFIDSPNFEYLYLTSHFLDGDSKQLWDLWGFPEFSNTESHFWNFQMSNGGTLGIILERSTNNLELKIKFNRINR
ncbi:unnamed protein product [Caenorhabditis nigoni]